jgi:hypothetical protein
MCRSGPERIRGAIAIDGVPRPASSAVAPDANAHPRANEGNARTDGEEFACGRYAHASGLLVECDD